MKPASFIVTEVMRYFPTIWFFSFFDKLCPIFGNFLAQNRVFGHFQGKNAFFFAGFAFFDIVDYV